PAGGIDRIQSFLSLFGGNKLNVVALSDYTKKDRQKLENIRKSRLIKDDSLLTIADFVSQEEADIEDLFDIDLFCEILNGTYSLSGEHKLDKAKLLAADETTERLVKKAEAYFRLLPETIPVFDHFAPASWLLSNPGALSGDDDSRTETLERSETLFKALNALIG